MPPTYPPPMQQTSGKAIASLICGIINVFPFFIVAVILGHLSLSDIRKSAGRLKGQGLAIAGLVLGYLGIVFIPVILIIAAIAIPNLLRARIAANESAAVGTVRNLVTSEVAYSTNNPNVGFTCNLEDLASVGMDDPRLRSGQKSGYRFYLRNCQREEGATAVSKFQIIAVPAVSNQTGRRAFCADERGVVMVDDGGSETNCVANGSPLE